MKAVAGTAMVRIEIEEQSVSLVVDYTYTAGTAGARTLRNGDPGYPGDPPEVDIRRIVRGMDVVTGWLFGLLCDSDSFINKVIAAHEKKIAESEGRLMLAQPEPRRGT